MPLASHLVPLVALALVVGATPTTPANQAVAAQADGPAPGVLYIGRQGKGTVRMVQIGEDRGRQLLLLDVEVECEGFTPEGRGVAVVEEEGDDGDDGRFEVAMSATDTDTSDTVTGVFDDIDGRVRADLAALEIDVEVEGGDNAGPTGRCEETQQWTLEGRRKRDATRIEGATAVDADEVATGPDGVFTLARGDAGASVQRFDPGSLERVWQVDSSDDATEIAAAGSAVWVLDEASRSVVRLDAATGDAVATIALDAAATEVAPVFTPMVATDAALWVGLDDTSQLYRIDAASGAVLRIPLPGGVRALSSGPDNGVYAAVASADPTARTGRVVRVDAAGVETASLELATVPDALAFGGGTLWVGDAAGTVTQHDPATLAARGDAVEGLPRAPGSSLVSAAPGIWTSTDRGMIGVDEMVRRVAAVPVVGARGAPMAAGLDGWLWVLDAGYLVRVAS